MTTAQQLDEPLFLRRDYTEADEPIVMSSWIQSARRQVRVFRQVHPGDYFRCMRRVVQRLRSSGATIRVVCASCDASFVVGWACVTEEPRTVHYVYVIQDYRGQGVGRMLLADCGEGTVYTCKGRKPAPANWRFVPVQKGLMRTS